MNKHQYLVTDRAHFMCPDMHFAIVTELNATYDEQKMKKALDKEAKAHSFLRSLLKYESDNKKIYYDILHDSQIYFEEIKDNRTVYDLMKAVSYHEWNPFVNGLLKVYVMPSDKNMKVVFLAHHLLCDGRGLLDFILEFADLYVDGIEPSPVKERIILTLGDLPKGSELPWLSKLLVQSANKKWRKEQHKVTYEEYARFVEQYAKEQKITYTEQELANEEYQEMLKTCKSGGFSVNDWLAADLCERNATNKFIMAADIRSDLSCYKHGALGNYATAFSIITKKKSMSVEQRAKEIHKNVQKVLQNNQKKMLVLACYLNMEPELLDAAALSALGGFESKAGAFVGEGMFGMKTPKSYSITNLGKVNSKNLVSATLIPPASLASKLTMGVVTVNDVMKICISRREEK